MRVPTPFDASLGQEALGFLPALDGQLRELVLGAAGCSPYLKSLISKESTWLEEALDDPDAALEMLFTDLPEVEAKAMSTTLRQAKRRIALITGLADLGGVWPTLRSIARCVRPSALKLRGANCRAWMLATLWTRVA